MKSASFRALLPALVVLSCMGCADKGVKPPLILPPHKPPPVTNMIGISYAAADALASQLERSFPAGTSIIVTTLVSINQLESSSPMGRLISEQLANRFTHLNYNVIEVKTRNQLYVKRNEGELILTREIREIAQHHKVQLIVSGTYTETPDRVFVNLKVIDWESDLIRAAFDYTLSKDPLVKSLLHPA